MDLSGRWLAIEADDDLRRTWLDDDLDDGGWEPIEVPGHWLSTPAFAEAKGPLLYRTRFTAEAPTDDERLWLVLDGCFYQGDVWLDGGYVGDTEGYFFPHGFEVTEQMAARDDHVLGVELACSRPGDLNQKRTLTGAFQHSDVISRSNQPGGIWRPVRIEKSGPVRIRHLRVLCREATEQRAVVTVRAVLDAAAAGPVQVRTTVAGVETIETPTLAAGENQITWSVTVPEPELWWPHSLGDQPLHDVDITVLVPRPGVTIDDDDPDGHGSSSGGASSEGSLSDGAPSDGPSDSGDEAGDTFVDASFDGSDAGSPATGGSFRDRWRRNPDRAGGDPTEGEPQVTGSLGLADHHRFVASDRRARRVGFRQVSMRGWITSVNGERLFLKGATYGPTRALLGEATDDEVRADVQRAVDAGLDVLRVHSHIGHPALYEAADEAGLLLWQDLPLHGGYARTVRKQAKRQAREAVDLLGHHPSVAIWCAHDAPHPEPEGPEPDSAGAGLARVLARQQVPSWSASVLDGSLRRTLQRNDGTRPVIAHSGVGPHPPKLDGTDTHLGLGWSYGEATDLPALARSFPRLFRFVSELGAQSVPTTDDFISPAMWPALDWQQLADDHLVQRDRLERHTPTAGHRGYDAWRDATQQHQAVVVRRLVEELRRLKYRPTGGVMVHTFADSQPAISHALLDHERVAKPAFDALVEACRPVIVVADHLPEHVHPGDAVALDVHVVSDRREPIDDLTVTIDAVWMGGRHTWRFRGAVGADDCVRVGTLQLVVPDAPGPLRLDLTLSSAAGAATAGAAGAAVSADPTGDADQAPLATNSDTTTVVR